MEDPKNHPKVMLFTRETQLVAPSSSSRHRKSTHPPDRVMVLQKKKKIRGPLIIPPAWIGSTDPLLGMYIYIYYVYIYIENMCIYILCIYIYQPIYIHISTDIWKWRGWPSPSMYIQSTVQLLTMAPTFDTKHIRVCPKIGTPKKSSKTRPSNSIETAMADIFTSYPNGIFPCLVFFISQ